MQPHGKFDTGVDAGRNHTAEKKAEPGRSRVRPPAACPTPYGTGSRTASRWTGRRAQRLRLETGAPARRRGRSLAAGLLWAALALSPGFLLCSAAQADVLVKNLNQSADTLITVGKHDTFPTIRNTQTIRFETGSNAGGYTLTSVKAVLDSAQSADGVQVSIYSASGGDPDTSLYVLTNPTSLSDGTRTFTALANAVLEKDMQYFVVFEATDSSRNYKISATDSDTVDSMATDWSMNTERHFKENDGAWSTHSQVPRIQIDGTARIVSTDATLSALALADNNGATINLTPTFLTSRKFYTAKVENSVDSITLTPTVNESNATFEYLDASNAAIIDTDTTTPALDAPVVAGDNTFKVKVTAEDDTTTETYTVVVTPPKPPKPDVTISAASPSEHYSTSHGATFTVTRTGATTSALTVTVNLRQDKPFLDESELLREVTIAAGSPSKNFSLTGSQLQLPANEPVETGTLTATVEAGPDNDIGAPASASVDIVPFMTVRPEQATYTVLEDVGTFSVKVIARTGNGAAQPAAAFSVRLDTQPETAADGSDYTRNTNEVVTFQPGNFSADGAAWKAVKTVQVTILNDMLDEGDEAFELVLGEPPGLDNRTVLTNADGTAAIGFSITRITIEDDERRPRLTLPPGSIKGVPERHDGVTPFDFTLEFSAAVDFTNAEMAAALQMEARNATVSAKAGDSRRMWTITATPNITNRNSQQIAITIRSPESCNEAGAICTADGRKLKYSRVVGVGAGGLKPRPPKPLTVGYILDDDRTHPVLDYDHDHGDFTFRLVFSEPLANAPRTGDAAARLAWWKNKLTVHHGGTLRAVSYIGDDGLDVGREVWQITVLSGIRAQTGVMVPKFTGGCTASNALCTAAETDPNDRRKLNRSLHVPIRCYRNCDGRRNLIGGFENAPTSHNGASAFDIQLVFSEAVGISETNMKDRALSVSGGTITAVAKGDGQTWTITLTPSGNAAVSVSLGATTGACSAAKSVCANGNRPLTEGITQSIPGPTLNQVTADPLTAAFSNMPQSHDGSTAFTFRLTFSEDVDISAADLKDHALTVTNGAVTTALALNSGTAEWDITLQPTGAGPLNILVSPTSDCAATGALCTAVGTMLSTVPGRSIPYADAVAPQPQAQASPLTAGFTSVPAEHDGGTEFWLELSFDAAVAQGSKRHIRALLGVTGGSVTRLRRKGGKGGRLDHWQIRIQPSSHEAVTVTLSPSPPCGAAGAVCTEDGRTFTTALATWIQGPPGLTVADAEVEEAASASLAFAVTLSRAPSSTVTVDYATADGTATAGSDYTAVNGTLTFAAGEREKTVSVPVLDDAHDEGSETLTLTLSNASGAYVEDGAATGTINNTDHMPKAWLARFGRTVAEQVLDAVGARVEGNSNSPGPAQLTLGGHRVVLDASWRRAEDTLLGEAGVLGQDLKETRDLLRAEADASPAREVSTAGFLMASSLHMASAGGEGEDESGRWSLWARGSRSSFSGREDALTLEGDVSTGVMGADYERGRVLAGVALAWSTGEGSYTEADARGEVESTLLSAYPYLRYTLSERLSVWGVLGLGEGGLTLDMKANENANDEHIETDISLAMAAFGARGKLASVAGYDLAVKTDVLFVRTESEAVTGLAAADARTRRLRLTLEGSREVKLDGGVLTPSLEIGLRHDGGDAETGSGVELGGGLRWAGLKGFSVEVRARGLLAHEERDYEEWGVSASIGLSPGEGDRGLSMRVGSVWGAASGGVERLWSQRALSGSSFDPDARLDAEVGYGLDAMRGLLTPYTGLSLSESGETYRAGARFRFGPALELNLEASLTEPDGDGEPASGLVLRGTKRW